VEEDITEENYLSSAEMICVICVVPQALLLQNSKSFTINAGDYTAMPFCGKLTAPSEFVLLIYVDESPLKEYELVILI